MSRFYVRMSLDIVILFEGPDQLLRNAHMAIASARDTEPDIRCFSTVGGLFDSFRFVGIQHA